MNVIDLTDKRFGKLLVLRRHHSRGNRDQIKWECICDCGNNHIVTGESLRGGKSKSCGCQKLIPPNKNKDRENALWKHLFNSTVIKRSKKSGILPDISFDEFIQLSKDKCFYCGLVGSNFLKDRASEMIIKYNGIDRVDSSSGYLKNNSVSCCKFCNTAKNAMRQDEFMSFIRRVYEYNYGYGLC